MAAPVIYHVLTEFRFEVGNAILGSEKLAGAVDNVSAAADNAMHSFQRLGVGLIASMGLGSASILGLLGSALQSSDKFAQSQRDLANIISSNAGKTMDWNQSLDIASGTMADINKKAREFSLSTTDLLSTSKQIGAVLLSHGLDNLSLTKSVDISRQYLKSAPTLGIDPGLAQQQLVRAILGDASGNDTLFNRLTGETTAMKQFGGAGGTKAFNVLDPAKRLDLLTRGLAQFSSNLNYVTGNAKSLSGELRILGENLKGPFSIFRSLGDILSKPVLMLLSSINTYLQTDGKKMVDTFSKLIEKSLETPAQIFASLFQAKNFASDFKLANKLVGIFMAFRALLFVLGLLGVTIPYLTLGLSAFGLAATIAAGAFAIIVAGLGLLYYAVIAAVPPLLLLLGALQLISRAKGYAAAQDLVEMPGIMLRFTESIRILKFIVQPILDAFDAVAKFISPLFQVSTYAKMAATTLEFLTNTFLKFAATISGIVFALLEINKQIAMFVMGKGFDFKEVGSAFQDGIDSYLEEALGRLKSGETTVGQTVNIGKVEIKNQFKENMEPDRVAFSLTKQLMKVAQNPTQSSRSSIIPVGAPS